MNEETLCQCGITEQTWLDYDLPCGADGLHLWETE